jgi:hypothetical protein
MLQHSQHKQQQAMQNQRELQQRRQGEVQQCCLPSKHSQHSSASASSRRKLWTALSGHGLCSSRQLLLQQASHTAQQRDHPHQLLQFLVSAQQVLQAVQEARVAPAPAGVVLHTLHHHQCLQDASAQCSSSSAHAARQQQNPAAGWRLWHLGMAQTQQPLS